MKNLLFIKLLIITIAFLPSCHSSKKPMDAVQEVKQPVKEIRQTDTVELPVSMEGEVHVSDSNFFEIKHGGPEQSTVDSIKAAKNALKKK
ncbi:hypothetical protein ACFLRI_00820 [Bacteroidota bacterium]